jgi:hypothetical protein
MLRRSGCNNFTAAGESRGSKIFSPENRIRLDAYN